MTDEKMTRYLDNWYWCIVGKDFAFSGSPGHRDWAEAFNMVMDWIQSPEKAMESEQVFERMGPDGFDIRICQGRQMPKHVLDSIIAAIKDFESHKEESHSIH